MPVHVSSAGLVLMANQPHAVQAQYLDAFRDPAARLTVEEVRAQLGEAAHQGYAQLAGVVDPDTWGIAVPVMDRKMRVVAAIGVVVPLREVRLQALVPALQTAARGIGRRLSELRSPA
jgi:DNA-binding IclR family transcriptional regulator